jgi:predicted Ser/Thr protein kinase
VTTGGGDPGSKDGADTLLRAIAAAPDRPLDATPARIAHFRVLGKLGQGGMGVVYRAEDEQLRRTVALKLLPEASGDEEKKQRFLREARSAAAITHPNVAVVYQVGEAEGRIYIAMELVDGESLRARLDRGRLDLATARDLAVQIARGLSAAHEKGIVHRDLKPENVMITPAGLVKILDFGLAKPEVARRSSGPTEAALAKTETVVTSDEGRLMGTPEYMSPEQAMGETLDVRSDVFSFGIVLYEMLAGARPFAGASTGAVLVAIARDEAPSLQERVPGADAAMGAVVSRCLAKGPAARFGSAGEIVTALSGGPPQTTTESRTDVQPLVATRPAEVPRWSVPWPAIIGAGLACAVTAAAVMGYRAAHLPRTRYCAFVDDTLDGPRCVREVPAALAATRFAVTPRFTEVGGKVVSVETLKFGRVLFSNDDWQEGSAHRTEILRGDDGSVRETVTRDRYGNLRRRAKWSEGGKRLDLVAEDGPSPRFRTDGGRWEDEQTSITTIRREFDGQGRLVAERFFAPAGRPAADEMGAFGYAYAFGHTVGTPVRTTVLGADGKPAADARGVSVIEASDDGVPGGLDVRYRDLDGKPVGIPTDDLRGGVYHVRIALSPALDRTSTAYFGPDDRLIEDEHLAWDPATRIHVGERFDEAGHPRFCRAGSEEFAARTTYDELGRVLLRESLDAQGNRTFGEDGPSAWRTGWDARGDSVLYEALDVAGGLMETSWGFARRIHTSDEHGNVTESRRYDEDGKPAPWRDGPAVGKWVYDARGLVVAESGLDAEERPAVDNRGAAAVRYAYNALGEEVESVALGLDGKPSMTVEGWASRRKTYDDNGDETSVAYFDATGAPAMYGGEFAAKRTSRDPLGLPAAEEYLGAHGERTLRKGGYATVRYARDRNGDVVEEAYFGKRDEPVLRDGGYAQKKTTYDVHRRVTEVALFDASGAACRGTEGWAIEHDTYDDRGLLARQDYLGVDGRPVVPKSGCASLVKAYDVYDLLTEESCLGVDGKLALSPAGYATKKSAYDEREAVVQEALLGADGKPIAGKAGWSIRRLRHDAFEDVVDEAFFDADERPTSPKGAAYASIVSRFDARKRLVETAYVDAAGAPANGPDGVAAVRYVRDPYGRATQTSYVDGFGAPVPSREGKIVVRAKYDEAGRVTEELFVDGTGAPHLADDGCAGHRSKYDSLGRKVEESCVGVGGSPALARDGWAIRRTLHDARGNDVEVATYAPDGALRADKDGIARRKSRFDERNLLLETTFFDASDKPAHDRRGAHSLRFTYDDSGKKTGESALDEGGRPVGALGDRGSGR